MINMCKKIRIRQKKYKKYYYCCDLKTSIYITECQKCLKKEFRKPQGIKKVSDKQRKLNNSRYSIFTNNFKECYYCHRKCKTDLHEVYGGSNRTRSIKNGLVVPLCRICHGNEEIIKYLEKSNIIKQDLTKFNLYVEL